MKQKQAKAKQKQYGSLSLPAPTHRIPPPNPHCTSLNFLSGRFTGKSTLVYSVTLPCLRAEESRAFLEEVQTAFLCFLKKQSEKQRDGVWFGGLDVLFSEREIILRSALCPFSQRKFSPRARLLLKEDGSIEKIRIL